MMLLDTAYIAWHSVSNPYYVVAPARPFSFSMGFRS